MKTTLTVIAMMSLTATAGAQVVVHEQHSKAEAQHQLQVLLEKTPATGIHVTFEQRPVTGAPYSGEAVTEAVQVLADGNRIVRRTNSHIFRDGKGRTRRETVGPDGQPANVVITDPAAGISYTIDPGAGTAHRAGVATYVVAARKYGEAQPGGGAVAAYSSQAAQKELQAKIVREIEAKSHLTTGQPDVTVAALVPSAGSGFGAGAPSSKEDLGEQTIEGVLAKGTRTTTVIAAGAIGNEQPITVISEEWLSLELQVLVMTRHVDPRAGETTYRLTGIVRGEPNPSLFELPAGITVK